MLKVEEFCISKTATVLETLKKLVILFSDEDC